MNCKRLGISEACQYTNVAPPRPKRERADDESEWDLLDMELLHHFTTHTALTLSDARTLPVLQAEIPKLAFTNPYLLRGAIAIAALHRATKTTDQRLIPKAAMSMNSGLPQLQALVANLEHESPHAVTMYAGFVGLYALALPAAQAHAPESPLGTLLDAFELIRGRCCVMRLTLVHVINGPIGPLMYSPVFANVEEDEFADVVGSGYKAQLIARLRELDGLTDGAYRRPLLRLKRVAEYFLDDSSTANTKFRETASLLMAWPGQLDAQFLQSLHEYRPDTLVILAYYSLFMQKQTWFHGNWRAWILEALGDLRLPAPWSCHLDWINARALEF